MTNRLTKTGCVALLLALPLLMALGAFVNGYVIATLWAWFMVPAVGVPPLTRPLGAGIGLLVQWLTHRTPPQEERNDYTAAQDALRRLGVFLLTAAFTLAVGYVIHRYWQ